MGRRKILKVQNRQKLFDVPADEDSLIRHYTLTAADRLEIDLRRRDHNKGRSKASRTGSACRPRPFGARPAGCAPLRPPGGSLTPLRDQRQTLP